MGCHAQFPASYDELEGIQTLKEHWAKKQPIEWVQIHRLPEHVQFQHRAHVHAGFECQDCHGAVETYDKLSMVARHDLVAVAVAHGEARDGLVHRLSPAEQRDAGLCRLPLLGERPARAPELGTDGRTRSTRIPEAGRRQRRRRRRGRLLRAPREADPVRGAARGDHAGPRGDLRVDLPGVQRRLRRAREDARGSADQARGQPRAPDQPRRALRAGPGGLSPHLSPRPLPGPLARGARASSRRSPGTRRSQASRPRSARRARQRGGARGAGRADALAACSTRGSRRPAADARRLRAVRARGAARRDRDGVRRRVGADLRPLETPTS